MLPIHFRVYIIYAYYTIIMGLNTFTSFDAPLSHDSHVNLLANTMMS